MEDYAERVSRSASGAVADMVMIYLILVAQAVSFALPIFVAMPIQNNFIAVMTGFCSTSLSCRYCMEARCSSRFWKVESILLKAGAALFSSIAITLVSGLGWSLIFGLISSTLFTRFVIPVSYWLLKADH